MYVIKDGNNIYPADRCSWVDSDIVSSSDGANRLTRIKTGMFYTHNSATSLSDPIYLGYLGKYGRFIPITD